MVGGAQQKEKASRREGPPGIGRHHGAVRDAIPHDREEFTPTRTEPEAMVLAVRSTWDGHRLVPHLDRPLTERLLGLAAPEQQVLPDWTSRGSDEDLPQEHVAVGQGDGSRWKREDGAEDQGCSPGPRRTVSPMHALLWP